MFSRSGVVGSRGGSLGTRGGSVRTNAAFVPRPGIVNAAQDKPQGGGFGQQQAEGEKMQAGGFGQQQAEGEKMQAGGFGQQQAEGEKMQAGGFGQEQQQPTEGEKTPTEQQQPEGEKTPTEQQQPEGEKTEQQPEKTQAGQQQDGGAKPSTFGKPQGTGFAPKGIAFGQGQKTTSTFGSGSNNTPIGGGGFGAKGFPKTGDGPQSSFRDGNNRDGDKPVLNKPKAEGDKQSGERGPKYVPKNRDVKEVFEEDEKAKPLYSKIFADDEKVEVSGLPEPVIVFAEWADAKLNPTILNNLERAGYTRPRSVQSHSIPAIMGGHDVKAKAETGSGKSAAFLLPIINDVSEIKKKQDPRHGPKNKPFAIIMEPTRELTLQVYEQGRKFAFEVGVQVVKCYGQYDVAANGKEIYDGCDIVVGTPGRLKHFVLSGDLDVSHVKYFVLDEADRLIEAKDFLDIVNLIRGVSTFPKEFQTLLFSATFPDSVEDMTKKLLKEKHVFVHNEKAIAPNSKVSQAFIACPANEKKLKVLSLLKDELKTAQDKDPNAKQPRAIVFVQRRSDADLTALFLCEAGLRATTINGDRPQREREIALAQFRGEDTPILVATDVCARGLDIHEMDLVINQDMPDKLVTYVHRIGRTGRLKNGRAISLFDKDSDLDKEIAGDLAAMLKKGGMVEVPAYITKAAKPVFDLSKLNLKKAAPDANVQPIGMFGKPGFQKKPGFGKKPDGPEGDAAQPSGGASGFGKPGFGKPGFGAK